MALTFDLPAILVLSVGEGNISTMFTDCMVICSEFKAHLVLNFVRPDDLGFLLPDLETVARVMHARRTLCTEFGLVATFHV